MNMSDKLAWNNAADMVMSQVMSRVMNGQGWQKQLFVPAHPQSIHTRSHDNTGDWNSTWNVKGEKNFLDPYPLICGSG